MAFLADTYNTYLGKNKIIQDRTISYVISRSPEAVEGSPAGVPRHWREDGGQHGPAGQLLPTMLSASNLQVGLTLPHEPRITSEGKEKPQKEMKPAGYHPRYD